MIDEESYPYAVARTNVLWVGFSSLNMNGAVDTLLEA